MDNSKITDYRQLGCGCCTGRAYTVKETWGEYEDRTDRCTCWMHQDMPRGIAPKKCSQHGNRDRYSTVI